MRSRPSARSLLPLFLLSAAAVGPALAQWTMAIGDQPLGQTAWVIDEADLGISIAALSDPIAAGDVQFYEIVVANDGPADAVDVVVQHELPTSGIGYGVEPAAFPCVLLSGSVFECDLGTIPATESRTLLVGVLIDHRFDSSHRSEVALTASNPDPASGNDVDDTDTSVVRAREILATNRGTNETTAIVAKEGDSSMALIFADSDDGTHRDYSVEAVGSRTVALAEVMHFGGTPSPEVAALVSGFDGSTQVIVVDAQDQALLGEHAVAGDWLEIDAASVADFGDTPADEVAILVRSTDGSEVRVKVLDASSGTQLGDYLVDAGSPADFPIGFSPIDDFDGTPGAELAIASKNPITQASSIKIVDSESGALLTDVPLGADLFPLGVVGLPDLGLGGGTPAPDVAVLFRRASDGDLFAEVFDADSGASFGAIDFDDALQPIGAFEEVGSFGGSAAPELAAFGRVDPSDLKTEIRDAASGAGVNAIVTTSPGSTPIPLGLASHDSFAGSTAPEVSVLSEIFMSPAQVDLFDAAGAAPLVTYFLP